MRLNGYFGVRSLEVIAEGLKSLSPEAQGCLFIGLGIAAYGYFKYGRRENNGNSKKAR